MKHIILLLLLSSCLQREEKVSNRDTGDSTDKKQGACLTSSATAFDDGSLNLTAAVTYQDPIHHIEYKTIDFYKSEIDDQNRISSVPLVEGITMGDGKYKLKFKNLPGNTFSIAVRWLPMNDPYRPFVTYRKGKDFSTTADFTTTEVFYLGGAPLIEVLITKDLELPLDGLLYYADLGLAKQ